MMNDGVFSSEILVSDNIDDEMTTEITDQKMTEMTIEIIEHTRGQMTAPRAENQSQN